MGLGSEIRDPEKPIPDPGVKKALDPGSGSTTLTHHCDAFHQRQNFFFGRHFEIGYCNFKKIGKLKMVFPFFIYFYYKLTDSICCQPGFGLFVEFGLLFHSRYSDPGFMTKY
jgi:hypothetical protein